MTNLERPAPTRTRHAPLWRNRDYNLVMTGRTLAVVGSAMTGLAVMLTAFDITGSTAAASLIMSATMVGMLVLSLPAGALVDRWDRKRVMVWTAIVQAVALSSVAVALALESLTVAHLAAVAFLIGALGTFYGPAETASLKKIVPAPQLGTAFAVNQARQSLGSTIGPPLAGVLYGITRALPFVGDALAHLVAGVCAAFVRADLRPTRAETTKRPNLLRDIVDGLRFVFSHATLRTVALLACLANFGLNATFVALVLDLRQRGTTPALIGLIDTAAGIGGLLGAMAAPAILRRVRVGTVTVVLMAVAAGAAALTLPFARVEQVMVILFVTMLVLPAGNAGIMAYFTHLVPDEMQGRASSSLSLLSMGLMPVASVVAGFLLQHVGRNAAIGAGLAALLLVAALALASRRIRTISRTDDFATTTEEIRG